MTNKNFVHSLPIFVLIMTVSLIMSACPAKADVNSYIIRAEQLGAGTLREAVKVPAGSLPSNSLKTEEVHAGTNMTITEDETGLTFDATGGAAIDDNVTALDSTWSSTKIHAEDEGRALVGHNHDLLYLAITGKAADSDKLDNIDSTGFALAAHNHTGVYLPLAAKAADADLLDGYNLETADSAATASSYFYFDGTTFALRRKSLTNVRAELVTNAAIAAGWANGGNVPSLSATGATTSTAATLWRWAHGNANGVTQLGWGGGSSGNYIPAIVLFGQQYASNAGDVWIESAGGKVKFYDLTTGVTRAFFNSNGKLNLGTGDTDSAGSAYDLYALGPIAASRFVSTVAQGTAPYQTTSSTVNPNLNADLVDGHNVAAANSSEAANAYFFYDGATATIKRKSLAEVQAEVSGGGGDYVSKAGDTMTGALTVPTVTLQSSTVPSGNSVSHYPEEAAGASWANAAGFGTSAGQSGATASYDASTSTWYYNHNMPVTVPRFYKSTDGGASWTGVTTLDAYHAGAGSCGDVLAIGNGVLIAGLTNWNEIYRSTNSGATWTLVYDGPDAVPYLGAAATDGAGTVIFTTGNGGGIHRSTDYGATWTLINGIFTSTAYYDIEYANGVWITCGNAGNAYRSTNGGLSWSLTPISSGQAVGIAYAGGNNWVACSYATLNRWYRSTDNGASWTVGPSNAVVRYLFCVDVDAARTRIRAVGQNQALAYAVFTSTDGGATFTQETLTAPNNVARIFYSGYNGGRWVTGFATSPYIQYFAPNILDFVKINGSDGGVIMTGIPSATSTALHINTTTGKLSYSTSSLRFKDDVQPYTIEWDKFMALKPITYTERSTGTKGKHGLAAEWTAPVFPGEVPVDAQGKPFSVDYERIAGSVQTAAVQDLKRRDEEKDKLIEELLKRVEALEAGR